MRRKEERRGEELDGCCCMCKLTSYFVSINMKIYEYEYKYEYRFEYDINSSFTYLLYSVIWLYGMQRRIHAYTHA